MSTIWLRLFAHSLALLPAVALAALPAVDASVRYLSLGDSLAAGYKAMPATSGYAYQLYLDKAYGRLEESVFTNAAVPGATSADVLHFQLPQVPRFRPNVVTLSVGGNDLLSLLGATPPTPEQVGAVLGAFAGNLTQTLIGLCTMMPAGGQIYLHNLYEIPSIPETIAVVPLFNGALAQVAGFAAVAPACQDKRLDVADVYSAFYGQEGLLLIERYEKKGFADTFEVHPTNKGHRVIEAAFRALRQR